MNQNSAESLPTWRLWGEERERNAIFTVYLKKVRYHRPTTVIVNDSDSEISHLEWETVRVRFVKAATIPRLVEALASDDSELESTFINVFLSTYRTFTTSSNVLDLLIKRYEMLNDDLNKKQQHQLSIHMQHQKSLISTLHAWLDGFPEDWNEENLRSILAFSSKKLPRSDLHLKAMYRLERLLRFNVQQTSADNTLNLISQDRNEFLDQVNDFCLTPAFRGPSHLLQAYRFPHVPIKHFAEQLTRMDTELFKRLIPYQCLGATWARRDKNEADTVVATVTQFNAVSFRVISSILIEPRLKAQERALHIATWIDIAQELRLLKNFSSLKAIISGLQSSAIYRLSKTWAALPREKMEIFNELARIFSEDNNAYAQREVLMREGTAKFADTVGVHDRHLPKIIQKQSAYTSHGTIPYMGTFLTDLTMIHAAIPDTLDENNFINFDKKRKEFEVLAQIKLLQGAANTYNLKSDANFDRWFASVLVLNDRQSHSLSCQLEPPSEPRKSLNNTLIGSGHCKSDSIVTNSSGTGSQFYFEIATGFGNHILKTKTLGDTEFSSPSVFSTTSSMSNLSMGSSNSDGQKSNNLKICDNLAPIINAQLVQETGSKHSVPDFYIVKVTYETNNVELDGIVLYKSIMLGNNERTPQVIRNAMLKLDLQGDPEQFTLAQVLPDKELVMPPNANVYYAVNTAFNLNFILRPKKM